MSGALTRKKVKFTYKQTSYIFVFLMLIFPISLFLVFYIGGNFYSFLLAFQKIDIYGNVTWVGFDNFKSFLSKMTDSGDVLSYGFVNSLEFYAINLCISMPLYIVFSYLIYKKCFLHGTIRAISMVPQIISGFVVSLLFAHFLGSDGGFAKLCEIFHWNNGSWFNPLYTKSTAFLTCVFYTIWLSFGTNLIVYPNAMNSISPDIIDSSKIDGVDNMFSDLHYIILPLIFPTIETFLVTGISGIFSATGPLVDFYYTGAPEYVYMVGYYYTIPLINPTSNTEMMYPFLSAGGLLMTLVACPLTFGMKWLCDHFGPSTETEGH
jgi:putative aldouronate transport system permease protein